MGNITLKAQLGANIAERRREAGLSKSMFALMVGVSRPYLSRVETGRANPTIDLLERIAEGLDTTVVALFGEE